jgi:HK97 family phage portal protein
MKKPTLLDKIANALGYIKQVAISSASVYNIGVDAPKKTKDYLESYKSWVFACVKVRSTQMRKLKIHLLRIKKDNETEEVFEHPALQLLNNVNPWQTAKDLVEQTQINKDLAGESFWLLIRTSGNIITDTTSMPVQIWQLRPDYISIETDEKEFITGYKYRVPGAEEMIIPKENIIHHKEFNPTNVYRGMSIVGALAVTIDSDDFAERYNRSFFKNSAMPSVTLSTEQKLSPEQAERMREEWNNNYKGHNKAHNTAILEGGLQVNPFSISQKDMEFLAGMGFNEHKIMALFQVPKSLLGISEGVTVSNAEANKKIFAENVTDPLMDKFVDTLNEFLLPNYSDSDSLIFTYDDPVPENVELRLKKEETLFKLGAISPNEIRSNEGLDEVVGLDDFYLPMNIQPVGSDNEEPVKSVKKKPLKYIKHKSVIDSMKEDIKKETMSNIRNLFKKVYTKEVKDEGKELPLEKQIEFSKQFIRKSEEFEEKFLKLVRKNFKRQEKETLERLERVAKAVTQREISKILFSITEENKISATILVPVLQEFMEETGDDALTLLGFDDVPFDASTRTAQEYLKTESLKGVKSMNKTTKIKLRKAISEQVSEGAGVDKISRAIRGVFTQASSVRSLRIARSEVIRAGNRGALEAYRQSGVVIGKQWFTAEDERVCQWCNPLNGKIKTLDLNYFNKGETILGQEGGKLNLNFLDVDAPPLHPNCRCVVSPVVIDRPKSVKIEKDKDPKDWKENETIDREELKSEIRKEVKDEVKKEVMEEVKSDIKEVLEEIND